VARALQVGATPSSTRRTDPAREVGRKSSAATPGPAIPGPVRASVHSVHKAGHIGWSDYVVGIDSRLAGQKVLVVARDFDLAIYGQTGLLRRLTIDTTSRYQPTPAATNPPASHPAGAANVSDVLTELSAMSSDITRAPVSVAATRTPMDCCANIYPATSACTTTTRTTSTTSPPS
jgi:hypothetical protein